MLGRIFRNANKEYIRKMGFPFDQHFKKQSDAIKVKKNVLINDKEEIKKEIKKVKELEFSNKLIKFLSQLQLKEIGKQEAHIIKTELIKEHAIVKLNGYYFPSSSTYFQNNFQKIDEELADINFVPKIASVSAGSKRFIEVKTTTEDYNGAFYLTDCECRKMKEVSNYFIYRIFNFNEETVSGRIYIIDCIKGIENFFNVQPVSFKISPK